MQPYKYYQRFVAAIVQRSGIARPTVEALLPHVFDEIRQRLAESDDPCVPIESFGTFHVKDIPEHEFLYHRGDVREIHIVPAKKQVKFVPTRNMRTEVEQGRYDQTHRSFFRNPGDPAISKRHDLRYRKAKNYSREDGPFSRPIPKCRYENNNENGH